MQSDIQMPLLSYKNGLDYSSVFLNCYTDTIYYIEIEIFWTPKDFVSMWTLTQEVSNHVGNRKTYHRYLIEGSASLLQIGFYQFSIWATFAASKKEGKETSLSFSFLICKMRTIRVTTSICYKANFIGHRKKHTLYVTHSRQFRPVIYFFPTLASIR